jgi:hypothetical protein
LVPKSVSEAAAATVTQAEEKVLLGVPLPAPVPGEIESPGPSDTPVSYTTIYVTPGQADRMRTAISNAENTPQWYDTVYHNCVNGFAVQVLRAGGVNAPMDRTPGGLVGDLSK